MAAPAMLTDAAGQNHVALPADAQPRIVSLVPSITELLCELGLASQIVGRTGFCIHPAALVHAIPKIGGTKDVNIAKIRALAPTHAIVNIDENTKPTADALAAFIPHVIVTHPQTPRDNLDLYRLLGGIFGATSQAGSKANALCRAFEHAHAALATRPKQSRSVLYCIWQDPWMTVSKDTYIANMLAEIGWHVWQAPTPERYPAFDWSPGVVDAIDTVLLSTEPYHFTETHVDALERQLGKPVQLVDGEMLSWYGSRAIAGLRYLHALAAP